MLERGSDVPSPARLSTYPGVDVSAAVAAIAAELQGEHVSAATMLVDPTDRDVEDLGDLRRRQKFVLAHDGDDPKTRS